MGWRVIGYLGGRITQATMGGAADSVMVCQIAGLRPGTRTAASRIQRADQIASRHEVATR